MPPFRYFLFEPGEWFAEQCFVRGFALQGRFFAVCFGVLGVLGVKGSLVVGFYRFVDNVLVF
jgi:hypothetical protein